MRNFLLTLAGSLLLISGISAQQLQMSPASQKMALTIYALKNLYVDKIDENKVVENAIRSMVEKLDPHSAYMTADEMKEMNEPLQGGFDGIGISFNMFKDTLLIVEVIAGGPSEKVGLLPGDRIIRVDNVTISGVKMSNKDVMSKLKGPKGTPVTVSIKRNGYSDLLNFKIIRDKIPIYSIDASFMVDKKTGYVRISRFGATTSDEFKEALKDLKKKGMSQLIIDLESNGGGYLSAAIDLADEFLTKGRSIVYTQGLNSPKQENFASDRGDFETGKLIILIDEYSASASEILSGAVQDWDRGLIIGRRSFGKGLVQRPIPLPDGSMLKLTVAKYFTPSGRFIQKPYENAENYSRDLIDRYNRGEMSSADNIHFPDSLRTSTLLNKRSIFGGGGIMPDVFVPLDTTRYTSIHRILSNTGILNQFSLKYLDEHRSQLRALYPDVESFITKYNPDDSVVNALLEYAKSEKVVLTDADLAADKSMMIRQLKAYMARDFGKSSDYYKVMWKDNESLIKALDILNKKDAYEELLKRH